MNLVPALCWKLRAQEGEKCRRLQETAGGVFFYVFAVIFVDSTFLGGIIYCFQNPCWFHYIFEGWFSRAARGTQRPTLSETKKKQKKTHAEEEKGRDDTQISDCWGKTWLRKELRGMDAIFSPLLKAARGGICFSSGLFSSFETQRAIKPCSCRMAEEECRLRN